MPILVVISSTLKSCYYKNTHVTLIMFQIKNRYIFSVFFFLLSSMHIVLLHIQFYPNYLTTSHHTVIFQVIFSHDRFSCFKTWTETITEDDDVTESRLQQASYVCCTTWLFHNSSRRRQNLNTAVQVHGRFFP